MQKYAMRDMRQVSFMTRFRTTAQQMAREPSTRVDSSTIVKIESAQSGELSPAKGGSYAYASAPSGVLQQSLVVPRHPLQIMYGSLVHHAR